MEQSTQEEWRPVVGYEGAYEVSDLGRLRSVDRQVTAGRATYSVAGQMIGARRTTGPYLRATLKSRGRTVNRYVHRLVAEAFCGGNEPGLEVRHRDGDTSNNRAENLTWGTRSDNMLDQVEHGTHAKASMTHCARGHEYTPENTILRDGSPEWRRCVECKREYGRKASAEYRARRAAVTPTE